MSARNEAAEAAPHAPRQGRSPAARRGTQATRPPRRDDQGLSDEINALLRDAAEQRERRTQALAEEDSAAARRQFDEVMALARAQAGKPRG